MARPAPSLATLPEGVGVPRADPAPMLTPVVTETSGETPGENPGEIPGEGTVEELAVAAQRGSPTAFEQLVERTSEPLVGFLRLRARNQEDAEELAQEAFLRAWRNIDRYDPRWRFRTWLFTIAQRLAVSRFRKVGVPLVGELPELADSQRNPERLACAREERENLWAVARRVLGGEQRAALWLRYGEDLPAKEVARVLGRREVTVRVMLHRARERLAPHLDPIVARAPAPEASRPTPCAVEGTK